MLAQPDTELREPWHNGEDQVSGSDTIVGTHSRAAASASDRRNTSAVAREQEPSPHLRSEGNNEAAGRA